MMPISGVNTGTIQPLTTAEKIPGASRVQSPGEKVQCRQAKPAMDEYIPEEPREPSGRYWMGRDENGQPKIYFDNPEPAAEDPRQPEGVPKAGKPDAPQTEGPDSPDQDAKGPEKKEEPEELWQCDTGKVDREIKQLKKKRQELEQQLHTETDEARTRELGGRLAQVDQELRQKDNDTYRKQHSTFTQLS